MREGERKREKKVCDELFAMFVPSKNVKKQPFGLPAGRLHYNARTFFGCFLASQIWPLFYFSLSQFPNVTIFSFGFIYFILSRWFSCTIRSGFLFSFHRSVCLTFLWFLLFALSVTSLPCLCAIFKNVISVRFFFFGVSFSYLAFVSYA